MPIHTHSSHDERDSQTSDCEYESDSSNVETYDLANFSNYNPMMDAFYASKPILGGVQEAKPETTVQDLVAVNMSLEESVRNTPRAEKETFKEETVEGNRGTEDPVIKMLEGIAARLASIEEQRVVDNERTDKRLEAMDSNVSILSKVVDEKFTTIDERLHGIVKTLSVLADKADGNVKALGDIQSSTATTLNATVNSNTETVHGIQKTLDNLSETVHDNAELLRGLDTDMIALGNTVVKASTATNEHLDRVETAVNRAVDDNLALVNPHLQYIETDTAALKETVRDNGTATETFARDLKTDLNDLKQTVESTVMTTHQRLNGIELNVASVSKATQSFEESIRAGLHPILATMDILNKTIDSIDSRIVVLEKNCIENDLSAQFNSANERLHAIEASVYNLKVDFKSLVDLETRANEANNAHMADLRKGLEDTQTKVVALDTKTVTMDLNLDAIEKRILDSQNTQLAALNECVKGVATNVATLKKSLDHVDSTADLVFGDVRVIETNIAKLDDTISSTHSGAWNDISAQITGLDDRLKGITTSVTALGTIVGENVQSTRAGFVRMAEIKGHASKLAEMENGIGEVMGLVKNTTEIVPKADFEKAMQPLHDELQVIKESVAGIVNNTSKIPRIYNICGTNEARLAIIKATVMKIDTAVMVNNNDIELVRYKLEKEGAVLGEVRQIARTIMKLEDVPMTLQKLTHGLTQFSSIQANLDMVAKDWHKLQQTLLVAVKEDLGHWIAERLGTMSALEANVEEIGMDVENIRSNVHAIGEALVIVLTSMPKGVKGIEATQALVDSLTKYLAD